ncbi:MAG: hypothetical protein ABIJ27_08575 [Candidatus Omnitrophota bacterium]
MRHEYGKKLIAVILIMIIALDLSGCAGLRKKFTRKRKPVKKRPAPVQTREYKRKPTKELYERHYVFWKTWHDELIQKVGMNEKKDMRCIEEIIANLSDLKDMLDEEKAKEMQPSIDRMAAIKERMEERPYTKYDKSRVVRVLESEGRGIKSNFSLSEVDGHLKDEKEQ